MLEVIQINGCRQGFLSNLNSPLVRDMERHSTENGRKKTENNSTQKDKGIQTLVWSGARTVINHTGGNQC